MAVYLVDTCVISELVKKVPNPQVVKWIEEHERDLYLSAITVEEMRFGALMLPEGKRRTALMDSIDILLGEFGTRIWDFDAEAADICARLYVEAIESGNTPTIEDLMIGAISLEMEAKLVTRNVRDFKYLDIPLVNPFE